MTQTLRTEASSRGAGAAASASQARWAAPGGSLPLRARLALLMLAVLTPALLLTAALLWDMDRQAIGAQERQLAATARTLALVVDARIAEQVAVLEALAVSPQLAQADWAGFSDQAKRALSGSEAWVAVGDAGDAAERRVYMNTLRRRSGPIPAVVKAAPTWSGKRGGALVSDGLWGPASGEFLTLVKKTVRLKDGRVVELVVAEPAASFSALLQRQGLPSGWTASVLDSRHQVVARNHGAERLTGHKVESAPLASAPRGVFRDRTFEGTQVIAAFDRLPGYGWTAVVAMPQSEATGAAARAIILGLVLGLLLLTAGVLMAWRMGRRIATPVERLAKAASKWVEGEAITLPTSTGLPETDHLSQAFAAAMRAVDAHDERQRLLINELNHRVKNTLATVQAVAVHTRRGAASIDDYYAALEGRVLAMARAHEILTGSAWEGAELGALARQTLSAFSGGRLKIHGPPMQVAPTDALNLALILYELATNASKHGALSSPKGEVDLSWRIREGKAQVSWVESGGPKVTAPSRQGFGSRLIARAAQDLKPSEVDYAPDGVRCYFTIRLRPD